MYHLVVEKLYNLNNLVVLTYIISSEKIDCSCMYYLFEELSCTNRYLI